MYKEIFFNFDISRLQEEMVTLLERKPLGKHNQLALMHRIDCDDPYYFGCGSLVLEGNFKSGQQTEKTIILSEEEFDLFNDELKDTYFYTIYKAMSSRYKLARMRIMSLKQKTCLTWHYDSGQRIHIPIITHPGCKFVLEDNAFHLPADGNAYIVDTTKYHTVFNGSKIVRIHLVCSILE